MNADSAGEVGFVFGLESGANQTNMSEYEYYLISYNFNSQYFKISKNAKVSKNVNGTEVTSTEMINLFPLEYKPIHLVWRLNIRKIGNTVKVNLSDNDNVQVYEYNLKTLQEAVVHPSGGTLAPFKTPKGKVGLYTKALARAIISEPNIIIATFSNISIKTRYYLKSHLQLQISIHLKVWLLRQKL